MLYKELVQNSDRSSMLGLGCMRLPIIKGGQVDQDKAEKHLWNRQTTYG